MPSASDILSAAGGTVALEGLGSVEIPAGALSEATTITLEEVDRGRIVASPDRTRDAGRPLALKPHGTTFETPVRVRIETGPTSNRVRVYRLADEDDDKWKLVRGETQSPDRTRVDVHVSKFSVYAAFEAETPSDCGPFDDDDDGVGDFCDVCDLGDDTEDVDGDGVPDACDNCPVAGQVDGPFYDECTIALTPDRDTYAELTTPMADHSLSTSLFVDGNGISTESFSYIGFSLNSVSGVSGSPEIFEADLRVAASNASLTAGDGIEVFEVGGFDEVSTNYSNQPFEYGTVATVLNADIDAASELRLDDAAFAAALSGMVSNGGDINLGLRAAAPSMATCEFASRESATPPSLALTFTPYTVRYLEPVADAHIDPAQPTANFGAETTMVAGAPASGDSNVRYIYMRFDLTTLPTCCPAVMSASLEMTAVDGASWGSSIASITTVDDDLWDELTITSGNAPANTPANIAQIWTISDPGRGDDQQRSHFGAEFTNIINNAAFVDNVITLRIEVTEATHTYYSREATDPALRPRLRVGYEEGG